MKTNIQLIIITIILTVVIWIYADQTSQQTHETSVYVSLDATPEQAPRIDGAGMNPNLLKVPVTLKGPKAAIRNLERRESTGQAELKVLIDIPKDVKPGVPRTTEIGDDISRMPILRDLGLQVLEVHTPAIEYTVDRYALIVRRIKVKSLTRTIKNQDLKPDTVKIRLLEDDAVYFKDDEPLAFRIDHKLDSMPKKPVMTFDLTLDSSLLESPLRDVEVKFDPPRVRVELELEEDTGTENITLIPLQFMAHPEIMRQYEFQCLDKSDLLCAIEVQGPKELLDKLKKPENKLKIDAYVKVTDDDLPKEPDVTATQPQATELKSLKEGQVRFHLPAGFEEIKITDPSETDPQIVKYMIKKRHAPTENVSLKSNQ